jgi:hypothetical protein
MIGKYEGRIDVCMMMWVKVRVTGDVMKEDENEDGVKAYAGTAGVMLDFSLAAGLEPIRSSFSRRVFSWEIILRVAILVWCLLGLFVLWI